MIHKHTPREDLERIGRSYCQSAVMGNRVWNTTGSPTHRLGEAHRYILAIPQYHPPALSARAIRASRTLVRLFVDKDFVRLDDIDMARRVKLERREQTARRVEQSGRVQQPPSEICSSRPSLTLSVSAVARNVLSRLHNQSSSSATVERKHIRGQGPYPIRNFPQAKSGRAAHLRHRRPLFL